MNSAGDEPKWLVKSSGRILGPMTSKEVLEDIRLRVISVIDEVQSPGSRWKHIREEPEFFEVVKRIRTEQENSPEDTMTSTMTSQTDTIRLDELTPTDTSGLKDVTSSANKKGGGRGSSTFKTYGVSGDQRVLHESRRQSRPAWVAAILLFLLVVGTVSYSYWQSRAPSMSGGVRALLSEGLKARSLGQMEKALSHFSEAARLDPSHVEAQFYQASMQIVLERQTLFGRRTLERLVSEHRDEILLEEALNFIGLSYLIERQYRQADEAFSRALTIDTQFTPAVINRAVTALRAGDYLASLHFFREAEMKGGRDHLIFLGQAMAAVELAETGVPSAEYVNRASLELERFVRDQGAYSQEARILLARLEQLRGLSSQAWTTVMEALHSDPYLSSETVPNYFLDANLLSWAEIRRYCEAYYNRANIGNDRRARARALLAFCLLRAGDDMTAFREIREAVSVSPRDPVVLGVQSFMLFETARGDEASASLRFALQEGESEFLHSLRARICEADGLVTCAQEHWNEVLTKNPRSVQALAHLGWIEYRLGNISAARNLSRQASDLSSRHGPTLELRERLGR